MNKHRKKMIAPILITILVIAYYAFLFAMLFSEVESGFLKFLVAVAPAALGATMIGVCIQRIKEIKGGEEDDLGKY